MFAPDMFSGWGMRTLSSDHAFYNPLSYHRGTVWAVEQATIVFGLRRFGFDARALDLAEALFDLARLYPEYRIPECVGGYARSDRPAPGAYPHANTPQLWNATAFPLIVQTLLGLLPVASAQTLVVDPALPAWIPELILRDVRVGTAKATLRFWRDGDGASKWDVVHTQGTLHVVRQPAPESLTATWEIARRGTRNRWEGHREERGMNVRLLPLGEQVIVITGASSGIGLVTAKQAAAAGARVVVAARNARRPGARRRRHPRHGGRAIHVVADVADPQQVECIAEAAIREFGRIDTWVNNAAVSMYGRIMELPIDDMRRQMDVNYWGQVYGSESRPCDTSAARRGARSTSAAHCADRAIPLQANYCAAKHALKAFTDALRMELEEEGVPISVTLIKPASVDTPFFEKARTYLGVEPQPVPPVYAPEVVADVILDAAQHPVRES